MIAASRMKRWRRCAFFHFCVVKHELTAADPTTRCNVNCSILHDEGDVGKRADVLRRIARNGDDVRVESGLQLTDVILLA